MKITVLSLALLTLTGCTSGGENLPSLTFEPQGTSLIVRGVIDRRASAALKDALAANPQTTQLVLQWVPGSADDDANLEMSRSIRAHALATLVPAEGVVASGGTDMFLAGLTRELPRGACVGVHTWAGGDTLTGADLPRDDPEHVKYLEYYDAMGIDRAFYWYTLDAAGPNEAHWMSRAEMRAYGMTTGATAAPASENATRLMKTCEARIDAGFSQ